MYKDVSELPVNIKSQYSPKAQAAYMAAFNSVFASTKDEARAFAAAGAAADKVDNVNPFAKAAVFMEATWDTAYINNLPDSSFAYIESGGTKDGDGKTVPRSLRHFPYKDDSGAVDLPHLRNALARAPQSPFGDNAMPKLKAAASSAGVGKENFREASYHITGEFAEGAKKNDEGVYQIPVTLIKPGLSKNKVYYGPGWLDKFASMMEGKKAYLNHETKSEIKDRASRSVNDVAGWYSGVHQSDDLSVKGTLNLVETPRTAHVIKIAQANPELVGLSINAKGKASRGKIDEKDAMIAETCERVYSTDIVTEAAAGGEMESMAMVAGVQMDLEDEEITMPDTDTIKEAEDQTKWIQAEWLETERIQETLMKETAGWLLAERDHKAAVTEWLIEEKHNKSAEARIVESYLEAERAEVLKDVPEGDLLTSLKEVEVSKAREIIDGLKKIMPDKPAKSVFQEVEEKQPGEEGYVRKLL